jgi:hypothetical protein
MRLITLLSVALLSQLPAGPAVGQEADPICPVLVAALAQAADTTQPLRLIRRTENPSSTLRSEAQVAWVQVLGAWSAGPDSLAQRVLAGEDETDLPPCPAPSRSSWHSLPSVPGDTATVTFSMPLVDRSGDHAVIFVAWRRQAANATITLSDGPSGSGVLYLLERRAGGWVVVRSLPLWALLLA